MQNLKTSFAELFGKILTEVESSLPSENKEANENTDRSLVDESRAAKERLNGLDTKDSY